MRNNIILRADSYKYSHPKLFPKGITNNYSYVEARWTEAPLLATGELVFFGLQYYINEYLRTRITKHDVDYAEQMINQHMGKVFDREAWDIIVNEFEGYLPIEIRALPEGSIAEIHEPLAIVRATDDRFAWLASFIETSMLRAIWYPSTVASVSRNVKKNILKALEKTADDPQGEIGFKLHDFGARGVSSAESAAIGGLAHLVNFMGTDTVEALELAQWHYGANGPVGFSIPASEHSTITSWGRENELNAFENMVDQYADFPLIACVSDSYNIWDACENKWPSLKDKLERNGTVLVVRPDSGDPVATPIKCVEILAEKFGFTVNKKGYKVLNGVRVIQGDGVNPASINEILSGLEKYGFCASNIAFGMGGALLQKVNRDTLGFAQKTCAIVKDGEVVPVYKDPVEGSSKKSLAGYQTNDRFVTKFRNGIGYNQQNFDEVRKNAEV